MKRRGTVLPYGAAAVVAALTAAGCDDAARAEWAAAKVALTQFRPRYSRDNRTGLCFANYDRSASHVPCSTEVLALVPEEQR